MPYYLNNASSNTVRVEIPSITIGAIVGDYIEFRAVANSGNTAGRYAIAGIRNSWTNFIFLHPTATGIEFKSGNTALGGGVFITSGYTQPSVGSIFTIRFTRVSSTNWQASINGSNVGSPFTSAGNLTVDNLYSTNSAGGSQSFIGGMYYIAISTNGGASVTRYYDPSNTNSGSILPETVSNQNGTQAGTWPTDDSEWVFYSSGATYDLQALGGTFSYSGATAALNRGFRLDATGGTFSYSGAVADLTYNTATVYRIDALGGSFTYTGAQATLLRNFRVDATGGAFSYVGGVASLSRGYMMQSQGGAFSYAGADASLTYVSGPMVYTITALGGAFSYTGAAAEFTATGVIPAANPAAFVNRAYVGGRLTNSAKIGGRLTNNAKIGGRLTNNATVAI